MKAPDHGVSADRSRRREVALPALQAAILGDRRARTTRKACWSTTAIRGISTGRCSILPSYESHVRTDPAWCRILEYYCPGCGTLIEAEYLPPGHPPLHDIELDIDALEGAVERRSSPPQRATSLETGDVPCKPTSDGQGEHDMKRVSVDIGGTFTDCFVAWEGQYIEAKALTTHHNLALGFNEALAHAAANSAWRPRRVLVRGRFGAVRDDARHQRADRAQGPADRRARHGRLRARPSAVRGPRLRRGPARDSRRGRSRRSGARRTARADTD